LDGEGRPEGGAEKSTEGEVRERRRWSKRNQLRKTTFGERTQKSAGKKKAGVGKRGAEFPYKGTQWEKDLGGRARKAAVLNRGRGGL